MGPMEMKEEAFQAEETARGKVLSSQNGQKNRDKVGGLWVKRWVGLCGAA